MEKNEKEIWIYRNATVNNKDKKGKKMNITEMKVDTKGRLTIPNAFLKANGLERGKCKVLVIPNGNDSEAIFRFVKDDGDCAPWLTSPK